MRGVIGQIGTDVQRFSTGKGQSRIVADFVAALVTQIIDVFAIGGNRAVRDTGAIVSQLSQAIRICVPGVKLIDAVLIAGNQAPRRVLRRAR